MNLNSGWKIIGYDSRGAADRGFSGTKRIGDSKSHAGQIAGEMLIHGCVEVDVYDQFGNLYKIFNVEED